MEFRRCKKCEQEKPLTLEFFRDTKWKNKVYFRHSCRECELKQFKQWRENNIEKHKTSVRNWFKQNPRYKKQWKNNNREHVRNYTRRYENRLYVKLKKRVARAINHRLKDDKNKSIFEMLPYTIDELKRHLESKFEDWMNWNNWGNYRVEEWDDNDPSTWRWQIDHIRALSGFKYESMQDPKFLEAWSLDNLRPLSAKQNLLDGVYRRRINKDKK